MGWAGRTSALTRVRSRKASEEVACELSDRVSRQRPLDKEWSVQLEHGEQAGAQREI